MNTPARQAARSKWWDKTYKHGKQHSRLFLVTAHQRTHGSPAYTHPHYINQ